MYLAYSHAYPPSLTLVSLAAFCHYCPEPISRHTAECIDASMTSHNRRNSSKLFHRHDKTVLSASRPLRRCELDNSRQLKTVADRKYEVWTRSEQSSNSHRHMIPDKTKQSRLPVDRHRDASQARSDVVRHAKCKHAVDCCT